MYLQYSKVPYYENKEELKITYKDVENNKIVENYKNFVNLGWYLRFYFPHIIDKYVI
jgi:hypothetical protein